MRGICFSLAASVLALSVCSATGVMAGQYRAVSANGGGKSVDRLFRNNGIDATRPQPNHAYDMSDARLLATYEGIEGARAAHLVYSGAEAESLDGSCESSVRVAQNETLYDIAALCDVSLEAMLDANPDIRNPRDVAGGRLVHVPGVPDPVRKSLVAAYLNATVAPLHSQQSIPTTPYVTQPGDSLERISVVHMVREDRIANLNPGVNWAHLPAGVQLRIPASVTATEAASAPVYQKPAATVVKKVKPAAPASSRDEDADDGAAIDTRASDEVSRLMPYRLGPNGAAHNGQSGENGVLAVDREFAKRGDTITVSGEGLAPNATVTIARGDNRNTLSDVTEVQTDASGAFTASVSVPSDADAGGIIFSARADESGETLYSARVGVDTVDE